MNKKIENEQKRILEDMPRAKEAVKVVLMKLTPHEDLVDNFLNQATIVAENPMKKGHFFVIEQSIGHMVEVKDFIDPPTAFFYGPFNSLIEQFVFHMACDKEVMTGEIDPRITELRQKLNEEAFVDCINNAHQKRNQMEKLLREFKAMVTEALDDNESNRGSKTLH